jgi:hypothetical protein
MRPFVALSALALAACAVRPSTVSEGVVEPGGAPPTAVLARQRTLLATSAIPNSALLGAEQQLEAHGYLIGSRQGDGMIGTTALPLPAELDTTGLATPVDRWMMRVDAMRDTAGRTTDLRVTGFLIPVDSTEAAIEIAPQHAPLYTKLQEAAYWLQGVLPAANRRYGGR